MKFLDLVVAFSKLDEKDHEHLLSMVVSVFLLVIGLTAWLFVPGGREFGQGMAPTAFVSLIPATAFFLARKLRRIRDIEGVIKVALRTDPLFRELRPELDNAKEICLLGGVLRKDFFRQEGFLGIIKAKKAIDEFRLRVCVYKPDKNNEILRVRARDESAQKIISIMEGPQAQEEKDKACRALIDDRVDRMATDIRYMYESFCELKDDKDLAHKIEIRFTTSNYILDSILIADSKVVICDYLHQSGSGTPFFVLSGNPAVDRYKEDFERVWRLAEVAH